MRIDLIALILMTSRDRLMKVMLARTTEVGSRNLSWAATQDMPSGSYVEDCHVSE